MLRRKAAYNGARHFGECGTTELGGGTKGTPRRHLEALFGTPKRPRLEEDSLLVKLSVNSSTIPKLNEDGVGSGSMQTK